MQPAGAPLSLPAAPCASTATNAVDARLDPAEQAAFEADAGGWAFFQDQAPSYRRAALHWVVSATRPQTGDRRLARLLTDSSAGQRLAQPSRPARADRPDE